MTRIQMGRMPGSMPAGEAKGPSKAQEAGEEFKAILKDRPDRTEDPSGERAEGQEKPEEAPEGKVPEGEAPKGEESGKEAAQGTELLYTLGMGQLLFQTQGATELDPATLQPQLQTGEALPEGEALAGISAVGGEEGMPVPAEGEEALLARPEGPEGKEGIPVPEGTENPETVQTPADEEGAAGQELFREGQDEPLAEQTAVRAGEPEKKAGTPGEARAAAGEEAAGIQPETAPIDPPRQTGQTAGAEKPEIHYVSRPQELPREVGELILQKVTAGINEFEIQLEPEHLGKIAIKVLFAAGQATVSILCSEQMTTQMLSQRAGEIGAVMERNLGETAIFVEEQQPEAFNQNQQGYNEAGRESEQEREREELQKQLNRDDSGQFLQKLRLGLTE